MSTRDLTLLNVAGNDHERGVAQGVAFRDRLATMYESLAALPLGLHWLPTPVRKLMIRTGVRAAGRFYLPRHRELLSEHAGGRYVRVLEGLAEGFDARASVLYGFHAFEVESGIVGFRMGCTALTVGADQSTTGSPRLAYNHDFPTAFGNHLVLRRSLPTEAGVAASLALTYEVLVGAIAGVNEHGLAVTVNQAFARKPRRFDRSLLPTLLVQDCLDHCCSVADAVARVKTLPVGVGSLLTLVDATGDRAVVELAPEGHAIRRPEGQKKLLVAFNWYRREKTQAQEIPHGAKGKGLAAGYDLHEANVERERRFGELTAENDGPWTDEDLHQMLADHDGGSPGANTICRHDPMLGGDTIATALFEPVARSVRYYPGFPCEGEWGEPVTL